MTSSQLFWHGSTQTFKLQRNKHSRRSDYKFKGRPVFFASHFVVCLVLCQDSMWRWNALETQDATASWRHILKPPLASIAHHVIHFFWSEKSKSQASLISRAAMALRNLLFHLVFVSHPKRFDEKPPTNHLAADLFVLVLVFPECSAAKFSALFCVQAYWILGGP